MTYLISFAVGFVISSAITAMVIRSERRRYSAMVQDIAKMANNGEGDYCRRGRK